MRKPHNHVQLLIQENTTGEDELADKFIESPEDSEYVECVYLHNDPVKRSYLEASLLASSDFEHISNLLEIDEDVIKLYAKIYYNVTELDKLSRMSLIELGFSEDDQSLKLWALSQGLSFIAWRLGKRPEISAVEGLTDLFNDCVFKSKEALFNPNSSIASRESTKWVKLSIDIGKLLKMWVTDSKAATKDIEIALQSVIPGFSTDKNVNEKGEIEPVTLDGVEVDQLIQEQNEAVKSGVKSVEDLKPGENGELL